MGRQTAARPAATLMLGYWLPVVLYVGVIFLVSAQPHLRPPLSFQFSDKLMHVLEYSGLGVLLARALLASGPRQRPAALALLALCLGIAIGTADELFQATVPGRQSSGFDLMADTLGVGLAQIVYRTLARG